MDYIKVDNIKTPHGFFTRQGGASAGLYDSLNCGAGSDDDPAHVRENLKRVKETLGAAHLQTLHQIHSATCVEVTKPWALDERPQADAMITCVPGMALGVLTADCAPVLFEGGGMVAAAHAGWKGALNGVLDAVIDAFKDNCVKPHNISAAIGPCVGPNSYEVSDDFAAPFVVLSTDNQRFFRAAPREGHLMFDLPGYCRARLEGLGVANVLAEGSDTLREEGRFFSYRRATHNNAPDYGRQISVIVIK